jgi:predicted PurR-regulated permease PerM
MTKPARISYVLMLLMMVVAAWFGLAVPLVAALFSYFALQKLSFWGSKTVALVLFSILVLVAGYGSFFFFHQAMIAFPRIAQNSIDAVIRFAKEWGIQLPFGDWESFKAVALETVREEIRYLSKRATLIGKQAVLIVVGFVVAVSLFVSRKSDFDREQVVPGNLYSVICAELADRFRLLYRSFATVMGAQMIISAINTLLTLVFVLWTQLPYPGLIVVVTFFCGLLPIIGNLISNTVIVSIAFTVSPKLGLIALVFLVLLHKLEYFLNSHIIGTRIKNPMWLTLLALIVSERLMGIPGMILAPVLLHYIKVEASKIRVDDAEVTERRAA